MTATTPQLTLQVLSETYAVCRLAPTAPIPSWARGGGFFSITRTPDELSIVCSEAYVPEGIKVERRWRVLRVDGTLDFSLVGILASLTAPLAQAGVSIFALSTYDTDYLLVKVEAFEQAVATLQEAGHLIIVLPNETVG
jgi:hypothetical protein